MMNRSALAGLSAVIVVMIVFTIMWILDITSLGGIMGAIGGMVGGVLGATYMQRFHDERFSQIMKKAASSAYWFVIIALPLSWIAIVRAEAITIQLAVGLTFVIWMSSFIIYYLSLFYYYKR
ncbi:MAG: hypothetical protein ACXADC_10580 [Candidatus Thorarchaeota archaeon]|jgi:hypothetical protein